MYLRGEAVAMNSITTVLMDASADAQRRFNKLETKHGIGSIVRRAQLSIIRRELRAVQSELWGRIGKIIRGAGPSVASAAAEAERVLEAVLFRGAGSAVPKELVQAQSAYARRSVANYFARGQNGISLSRRVYRTSQLSKGYVDRQINLSILQGEGWQSMARRVRPMIDPGTKGGVSYAAKRLARTELNNAFHTVQRESAEVNPFTLGVRWHLSRSHPQPDRCDELARGHSKNKERGVYLPGECPDKPHPQCLCYTTNEMMEEDDFLDLILKEDEEEFLKPYQQSRSRIGA